MGRYRKAMPLIEPKAYGLILCEGETEEFYFKGFIYSGNKKRQFSSINVSIYKPTDHSPTGLIDEAKRKIKEAKKCKTPYDFVWVVFDQDGHQNLAQAFNDAIESTPPINIAFTAKCFEYFILLHFVQTTQSFDKCHGLIKEVEKHIANYKKADKRIFDQIGHLLNIALTNSNWSYQQCMTDLDNGIQPYKLSAYCDIHKLIEYLQKL